MEIIDIKWEAFAKSVHYTGCIAHGFYVFFLQQYIIATFLRESRYTDEGEKRNPPPSIWYLYMIFGCLIYPLIYDGNQFLKQGHEYFYDFWNLIDVAHIVLGYVNIYA